LAGASADAQMPVAESAPPVAEPASPVAAVAQEQKDVLEVIEPTQGRPIIIQPEDNFHFMFWTRQDQIGEVTASLTHSLCPTEVVPLTMPVKPYCMQKTYWVMVLRVPTLAKAGVYDLRIDLGRYYQVIPRAVRIIDDFRKRFRFVQLSNMNIGDPTAPDFDQRLVDEVNLLNPEFILATGNFIEPSTGLTADEKWRRIKAFLGRFHSPVYILCGDLEDPTVFQKQVDPSPAGQIDFGPHHFVLMLDTARYPLDHNASTIEAVLENLKSAKSFKSCILVGHNENLRIIDGLKSLGMDPAETLKAMHIRMMICGGGTDWDGVEHAEKVALLKSAGVAYVRTGQSSTSMKNGGTGESRYRVFEASEDAISYIYPEPGSTNHDSIPVGRIRIFNAGPNDGSQPVERISILNTLNQAFPNCQVIFRVKATDPSAVRVANCRLEQVLRGDGFVTVIASVDLPDKCAVQVAASADEAGLAPFAKVPVEFSLEGDKNIVFTSRKTADGLGYCDAAKPLTLQVRNVSSAAQEVRLQACLEGQSLVVAPAATSQPSDAAAAAIQTVRIEPSQSVSLTVWPVLRSITPGPHYLAVYVLNDPLQRIWVDRVTTSLTAAP
jgi:hypothetical protein